MPADAAIHQHDVSGGGLPRPHARWALFLDLDGTLLDIAPRPEAVTVPASLPGALAAAREALGGALAIVTGRAVGTLDSLLGTLRLPAAGCHGAELRPDTEAPIRCLAKPPAAPLLAAAAEAAAAAGLLLERKPVGLVLHYRGAPALRQTAREVADNLLAQAGPGFEILPARMAFEIRPSGFDKASALRALMAAAPFAGRRPFFIGDDTTDDQAIAAAEAHGGWGQLLGRDSAATPADVRAWIADLPVMLERAA